MPADPSMNGSWRPVDLVALDANPPCPPELAGVFYVGLFHNVVGETESAKSWLSAGVAVDELTADRGVLWVDADDVGPGAVLERLRLLGAPDEQIARRFAYVAAPDEHLTEEHRADLLDRMRVDACRLVVLDGFNPLLVVHGLDPKEGSDVEVFYRHVDPFRKAGAAVVLADNVVKAKDARGTYAIGSERNKSKAEVQLGMRAVTVFSRGRTGRSRISVHKDRPGHLQRPTLGIFELESDGDSCAWRIVPDGSTTGDDGTFRPTTLMERVSRYLEALPGEAVSRNQIETAVQGKSDYVRVAIDQLIAEGYAVEVEGARRARLVQLQRPFVDGENHDPKDDT